MEICTLPWLTCSTRMKLSDFLGSDNSNNHCLLGGAIIILAPILTAVSEAYIIVSKLLVHLISCQVR